MNHKMKLGYMAIGAGIMLIGMAVGCAVSPSLVAQRNGVFDKITCHELEVVDKTGTPIAFLGREKDILDTILDSNAFIIFDMNGETAINMSGGGGIMNGLTVRYPGGREAFSAIPHEEGCLVSVKGIKSSRTAFGLFTDENTNTFTIKDPTGKESFRFKALPHRNELVVRDKSSGAGIGFYGDSNEAKQTRWSAPREEKQ